MRCTANTQRLLLRRWLLRLLRLLLRILFRVLLFLFLLLLLLVFGQFGVAWQLLGQRRLKLFKLGKDVWPPAGLRCDPLLCTHVVALLRCGLHATPTPIHTCGKSIVDRSFSVSGSGYVCTMSRCPRRRLVKAWKPPDFASLPAGIALIAGIVGTTLHCAAT